MSKKQPIDVNTPEARALREEIFRGAYLKEGTCVAFPLCFPGQSVPIAIDESHITALQSRATQIYGGTSGKAAHLFVAEFRGPTGGVFDLGVIDGATGCAAVCCASSCLVAAVNGPKGGRILTTEYHRRFGDMIQEWGFHRASFNDLGEAVSGEPIVHAVALPDSDTAVGITSGHLFLVDAKDGKIEVIGEAPGAGLIALTAAGKILGQDGPAHLWRFDPQTRAIERQAVALPQGNWTAPVQWARAPKTGLLYLADASGQLYACDETRGYSFTVCAKLPLTPAGPMTVTPDGRLFGFCGEGMAHLYVYEPGAGAVRDLGILLSVIARRRYGYEFGAAVTGPDGEIYFGERDNLGHLWHYFPRLEPLNA